MTTTPQRRPISLSDCEDILAYVPHALGFHPKNSMVLLLIVGNRLEATLRVDLPSISAPDQTPSWLMQVGNVVRRLPKVHRVVMVAYCDLEPEGNALPYQHLYDGLRSHLQEVNVVLSHGWCVSPTKYWDYAEPQSLGGTPLPDTRSNETNLSMILAGSAPLGKPWDGQGISAWPTAQLIREQAGGLHPEPQSNLESWSQVLDLEPAESSRKMREDPRCAAELLAGLGLKIVRDVLPFLAGAGHDKARGVAAELMADQESTHVQDLADYLLGKGWRSPDWQRTDRLWHVLRDLLGVAQGAERHAALCLLAWIEWARGRGSLAMTLLEQTLREDSRYRLARLLKEMLERGAMPEWVVDELRAWRAQFR